MKLRRVVVTGMGALTAIGNSVEEFWKNALAGVSGAAPITLFDASPFKAQFACEVKNFDPSDYISVREQNRMDRFSHLTIAATEEAVKDAGLDSENINKDRVGVILASGIGGLYSLQEEVRAYERNIEKPRFSPFFIPKMIANLNAGHVALRYGFRGPSFVTVSACASSTHSLIDAFNYIRLGKADVVVAGGAEAAVTASGVGGFTSMKAMSTRNDDPKTASRPFDKDRDGFVLGEGGGTIILEDMEHALSRGAKIYAELVGGGASTDAYHMTASHPEGEGAILAMSEALNEAQLSPTDVDHLNAHATSTPLGDVSEIKAIEGLFGDHASKLHVNATKSMTGHLLGGAGAIESILTIKAVQEDKIPPTINHFTDDEKLATKADLTFNTMVEKTVNVALCNTFGFGGHNATAAFKKFEE